MGTDEQIFVGTFPKPQLKIDSMSTEEKQEKLKAMIADLTALCGKHFVVLEKYAKENGQTEYYLKLQPYEVEVNIEDAFSTIPHGF
jgi:hypothetical protein